MIRHCRIVTCGQATSVLRPITGKRWKKNTTSIVLVLCKVSSLIGSQHADIHLAAVGRVILLECAPTSEIHFDRYSALSNTRET